MREEVYFMLFCDSWIWTRCAG